MNPKSTIFLFVSAWLVIVSWRSLRQMSDHGFYRFLAWEAIAGLVILNAEFWFRNPFSPFQTISWLLLAISLVLVGLGAWQLYKEGKQDPNRQGEALFTFEKTTRLVTHGLYRYIRHPLYSSLLFLAWGVFFKHPSVMGLALVLTVTGALITAAKAEEVENLAFFGEEYRRYIERSRLFIPYIF